jgi:5-hydroxyisourate hydrolase
MARLSTHVLDTARGAPAAGIDVELHLVRGGERISVAAAVTNADGRTDAPLVTGDRAAARRLRADVSCRPVLSPRRCRRGRPPFLDQIVIRFGVADPAGHYHVPLLLSPYGYSTYEGPVSVASAKSG